MKTVLLVDDSKTIIAQLEQSIKQKLKDDVNLLIAYSFKEAVKHILQNKDIHLAILDLNLPDAKQGDIVELGMEVVKFGKTSLTLKCEARNKMTRETILTVDNIIMVNLGEDGKPTPHGKTKVEFVKDRLE